MRSFEEIYEISAKRKGEDALKAHLTPSKSPEDLAQIPDHRWLSQMTRCIFQAGFNWKVVEAMWPGFEDAFHQFDVHKCAMLHGEDFDRLVQDTRIIRYGAKIEAVQHNAVFVTELQEEQGSAAALIANWPSEDFIGLLSLLKKRGTRLGGTTGQYCLRSMGKDSFILSKDVIGRLIAEGVIDKNPTSQKAMTAVQEAFNRWSDQSGQSLTNISRVLAMSL